MYQITEIMDLVSERLADTASSEVVAGDPMKLGDFTIITVSRVTLGLGAGGGVGRLGRSAAGAPRSSAMAPATSSRPAISQARTTAISASVRTWRLTRIRAAAIDASGTTSASEPPRFTPSDPPPAPRTPAARRC